MPACCAACHGGRSAAPAQHASACSTRRVRRPRPSDALLRAHIAPAQPRQAVADCARVRQLQDSPATRATQARREAALPARPGLLHSPCGSACAPARSAPAWRRLASREQVQKRSLWGARARRSRALTVFSVVKARQRMYTSTCFAAWGPKTTLRSRAGAAPMAARAYAAAAACEARSP